MDFPLISKSLHYPSFDNYFTKDSPITFWKNSYSVCSNEKSVTNLSESFCHTCGKNNPKKRCSECKFAHYCDEKCQKKDWKFHRKNCLKKENK